MGLLVRLMFGTLLLGAASVRASAQGSMAHETGDAVANAYARGTAGPATIRLGNAATLALPKDFHYIASPVGNRLVRGVGNLAESTLLGVAVPTTHFDGWFVAVSLKETGHVAPAALAALDEGDMRASFAGATRRGNAARMQLGFTALDAGAFLEPVTSEPARDRVTAAIRLFETGPSSGDDEIANIGTYVFGRSHTLQLTLVDTLSDYKAHRPAFERLAAAVAFDAGQRSADFVAGRDRAATQVLDVVFGGRSLAEIDAEAAEEAAEAKRIAALPPTQSVSTQMRMIFFAVMGLGAVIAGMLAFFWSRSSGVSMVREDPVERALRSGSKR